MNYYIYAQWLVRYRIFVWSSQLILWPLLRPLRFVINDRNKCTTSSLGKWRSLRSDDHKFLTHQLPPCSNCCLLDEIRTTSSNASYFVYYAFMTTLMFEQLGATCTIKMCLMCRRFLVFLRMFWPLISHFSLLFPFFMFFPCSVFILGFVSPSSSLSMSCVPW